MLSKEQIKYFKEMSSSRGKNPITKRHVNKESIKTHFCPICEEGFINYVELRAHIIEHHRQQIENDILLQRALDPISLIRYEYVEESFPLLSMGRLFGDIITSKHNQHVLLNVIGKTGVGKSNAGLRIALEVSSYIAKKIGGKPEDYFNMGNVAIMKLDSIIPIIEDIDNRKYNIIILDDIGASYGARDFQNKVNKNINKVFQTFRDSNTMVILTMPDTFLIDKVARKLAHFQLEVVEARHDVGISIGKLTQLSEQYRGSNKTYYHFVKDSHGVKYPRIVFKLIPEAMHKEYNKKRNEIRATMTGNCMEGIRQADREENGATDLEKLPDYIKYASQADEILTLDPGISLRALGAQLGGMSKDTAKRTKDYVVQLRAAKAAKEGKVESAIV